MTGTGADWRELDGVATAWFGAGSLAEGAALAGRVGDLSDGSAVDLRTGGVRVRLDAADRAEAVSLAARELGLIADPTALQHLNVILESPHPVGITPFWQRAFGYGIDEVGSLSDPLRRDPALRIRPSSDSRPLRNRIHLDVVRPAAAVDQADLGPAAGPYGVCHRDSEGNEVDLVPGEPLGGGDGVADWQAVFSAMACYRVGSSSQQRDLTVTAAQLADAAGFPLMIDVRPGLVILDSGKDRWEGAAERDFADLAGKLQTAARALGAAADLGIPRFSQLFLDAADVAAIRAFWLAVLGYTPDLRDGITDIVDPRRLNPVLVFQELDPADAERRQQRNRIQVELMVPAEATQTRVATAVAAGGRVLAGFDNHWQIADPEGNELVIVGAT